MSTTRDIKLNCFILKEISIFLIYKNTFQSILELSLLSKLTFKIFQNLIISKELNQYNFFLRLKQLKIYIDKSINEKGEDINYQYKLIQYKHFESIRFPFLYDYPFEHMGRFESKPWSALSGEYKNDQNKETKRYLNKFCPSLRYVEVEETIKLYLFNLFSCSGFFKIIRLNINWTLEHPPLSYLKDLDQEEEKEEEEEKLIGEKSLKEDYQFFSNYNYSFNFLNKINPIKIYLNSVLGDLHIFNLNNILNCKTIKTIKFEDLFVPMDFIDNIINNKLNSNIKSFQISFHSGSSNMHRGEPPSPFNTKDFLNQFIEILRKNINIKNYHLKRLSVGKNLDFHYHVLSNSKNDSSISNHFYILLDLLKNKFPNLSTLGLQFFTISNSVFLSPLDGIKLDTLICNIESLKSITQYCIKNKNIKKLNMILNLEVDKIQLETFEWFLSVSEQTQLTVFKIKFPTSLVSCVLKLRNTFRLNNKNLNLDLNLDLKFN
ncbi:hypothetical protein ACTA71_008583 [Dictyostelium dimigraforme]